MSLLWSSTADKTKSWYIKRKDEKKIVGGFNLKECNHEKIVDDQFRIRTFVLEEEEYK